MGADGAGLGGLEALLNVAAVQAEPAALGVGDEELAGFHKLREVGEAVAVGFLDLGNLLEGRGHLGEALLPGGLGEAGVDGVELLKFVMLGHAEELRHVVGQVHGVAAVDVDGLPGRFLHVVVENLGVLLLLVGGEGKNGLQNVELLLLAEAGGEGVAVPGLALSGKGPHQVFQGLALFEVFGHENTASLLLKYGGSISCIWESIRLFDQIPGFAAVASAWVSAGVSERAKVLLVTFLSLNRASLRRGWRRLP